MKRGIGAFAPPLCFTRRVCFLIWFFFFSLRALLDRAIPTYIGYYHPE